MRRRVPLVTGAALAAAALAAPIVAPADSPAASPPTPQSEFVLSPEGNHLWAYDAATGARQLLVRAVNGTDPGVDTDDTDVIERDVNGEVCVSPDGAHFVAGEDTVLGAGGSHDPAIAGWGWFTVEGDSLGQLAVDQVGKLAPEAGPGPGYAGDPDNFGCGFLDADRLVTTAIGDILPGDPANGQLFVWFGPFEAGFEEVPPGPGSAGFYKGTVPHCSIDDTLATAGGIAVAADGAVYVATNRPDDAGKPGGVWRYTNLPASYDECAGGTSGVTKELVVPFTGQVPLNPLAPTPSDVAISPAGTLYVSSVFSGQVAEYATDGTFLRHIYPLSPVAPPTGPTGNTPFGLAVTGNGDLWIADLGIVVAAPVAGQGSLVRVRFDDHGNPSPAAQTVQDGLTFPDGLGVYRPAPRTSADSEWGCSDWGMYGRSLTRQFSVPPECAAPIGPATVATLAPAWTLRVPVDPGDQATFTASPTIVDGVVYVGGWNERMYALSLDDGRILWEHLIDEAPGATFGPIVSSAAVADVDVDGELIRVVVFGGGPYVYALDATDGSLLWRHRVGVLDVDDPAEVESSPVIWDGTVYVGMDVHNQRGDRTGGVRGGILALDAATGTLQWKYSSEAATLDGDGNPLPPSGCGGVWGSPVIDPSTQTLFFGTANCPAVNGDQRLPMEEIAALDISGEAPVAKWAFRPHQQGAGPWSDEDEDFGATPNLFEVPDGDGGSRTILGAGSKDGSYYALDPATGDVVWETEVVTPAPGVGGFIGSPAVWDGNVFGGTAIGSPPFFHSFDGATGEVRWQSGDAPTYAPSAVVNGVAFAASLDGTLKAYDTGTGMVLWSAPLLGPGSSGVAVAGDTIVVGSGTSTSDLCAKGRPDSAACFLVFDTVLGQQGGVQAFRLAGAPAPALGGFGGE